MTPEQAEKFRYNIFDLTKVWPKKEYPLRPIGKLVLNENPQNYFAEIEQVRLSIVLLISISDSSKNRLPFRLPISFRTLNLPPTPFFNPVFSLTLILTVIVLVPTINSCLSMLLLFPSSTSSVMVLLHTSLKAASRTTRVVSTDWIIVARRVPLILVVVTRNVRPAMKPSSVEHGEILASLLSVSFWSIYIRQWSMLSALINMYSRFRATSGFVEPGLGREGKGSLRSKCLWAFQECQKPGSQDQAM